MPPLPTTNPPEQASLPPVQACAQTTLEALEVRVLNEDGQPQQDVRITLRNPDGQRMSNKTGPDGVARFEGLASVDHALTLHTLDARCWELAAARALPPERVASRREPRWDSALPVEQGGAVYTVRDGDCLYSIAHAHGLSPEALWKHQDREQLTGMSEEPVLCPGDTLTLPSRTLHWQDVTPGQHLDLRLKGFATVFRAELRDGERPRARLSCLVDVDGTLTALKTDASGVLEVPISPVTKTVKVKVDDVESFEVDLGELLPVTTVGGTERRLYNLGYLLYPPDEEDEAFADISRRAAIRWFQEEQGLEPTGFLDEAGQHLLRTLHGS